MRYSSEKAVKTCALHDKIKTACVDALTKVGYFAKDEVLNDLAFGTIADSVRWDLLRRFIEEDMGCELIPLAKPFFHRGEVDRATRKRPPAGRDDPEALQRVPQRFIAWGNGKRAFGYASINEANGALVIKRLEYRRNVAIGTRAKATKLASDMESRNVLPPPETPLLDVR